MVETALIGILYILFYSLIGVTIIDLILIIIIIVLNKDN